jgi:hypothetical protein
MSKVKLGKQRTGKKEATDCEPAGEAGPMRNNEMGRVLAKEEAVLAMPLRGPPRTGMATKRPERVFLTLSSGLPLRIELRGSILSKSPRTGAL